MRKFAKISAVLAAMVLALAFVGCKDDDDDDDDPSVVTAWYSAEDGATETVYFYDDSTFKLEATIVALFFVLYPIENDISFWNMITI